MAKVINSRLDTCSREVLKHDDLKSLVKLGKVRDHFICMYLNHKSLYNSDSCFSCYAGVRSLAHVHVSLFQSQWSLLEFYHPMSWSVRQLMYSLRNARNFWLSLIPWLKWNREKDDEPHVLESTLTGSLDLESIVGSEAVHDQGVFSSLIIKALRLSGSLDIRSLSAQITVLS